VSHESFIGRLEERIDTVLPSLRQRLAAALDVALPEGDDLPWLWHWALFQDWVRPRMLGADGHPLRGGLLPDDPEYPRRMWAGGRLTFNRTLRVGTQVRRQSRVSQVIEKQGASGRSLWVSVEHLYFDEDEVALTERQDLVYRAAGSVSSAPPPAGSSLPDAVREERAIDAVMLFRYSALTGNAHRIHYDLDYARTQEGYESLVVQGALQAILLADLAQRHAPAKALREFTFRARWPALLHRCPLTLEASRVDGAWQLRSLDVSGAVCMTAKAQFGP
jgi:3-methylfumaryl-CoA hydratase